MNIDDINRDKGAGIPTARNVDHVAFTVPDLETACRFFVTHLGATLLYVEGPIAKGAWMRERLNVDERASCVVALLRLGPTCNLELFQYRGPDQNSVMPRNSDVGGHHLGFYVTDIDAAFAYLQGIPGVVCHGTPNEITEGPIAGSRWLYFSTPWGQQMELTSPAPRLPYERHVAARRYGPHPDAWPQDHMSVGAGTPDR